MAVIVVDASVVIGFLDPADAHHARAAAAFAAHRTDELVLPASAYAEVLVVPARRGSAALALVEQFLAAFVIRLQPIDADVARGAALLRARHPALRLPDAFVLATGETLQATVLTADTGWPKLSRRARLI